jgi:Flp pilus assembly protein TadG
MSWRAHARRCEAGQASSLGLVLLAFVMFGFLGFAVDLGRLYLIRGELSTAAESMALAAAQELIGTNAAAANAQNAMTLAQSDANAGDNRFNFSGNQIGGGGTLTSQVMDPDFFATFSDATAADATTTADSTTARYVRVTVRADAPLTFWQFLPVGKAGITSVQTSAVAGISQPLCTACGIEPLAVVPANFDDTTDFGFIRGVKYTMYSQCTGTPLPAVLANTSGLIQYTLLNRTLDDGSDQDQQVFKLAAGGIPAPAFPVSDDSNLACPTINTTETRLPAVSVAACNTGNRGTIARDGACGLNARLDSVANPACSGIADVDTMIQSFPPDTDVDDHDDYLEYAGNRRRILTVTIVDALPFAVGGTMSVLGFRQFLLEPDPGSSELSPADPVGRFVAMYIGFPAPIKQGDFGSCGITEGPGKVVLHQ